MRAEQREQVEALFDELAGADTQRIDQALINCDAEVQAEVRRLLGHAATTGKDISQALRQSFDALADELDADLPAGTRIESFEILERLGIGGMGAVYRAKQDLTQRIVALKLIRSALLSPTIIRRFLFEVEALGRLNHPCIARVFAAGIDSGRQPYFAMELIEGETLDAYVRRVNPDQSARLALLQKIADALGHAHSRGIVHRDLKPANILVTTDGMPKVLDFGVARAVDSGIVDPANAATALTRQEGAVIGTLAYMAPEQIRGERSEIDPDTDVYALGVIGYELLAKQKPYDLSGKSLYDATRLICETDPVRPSSIARGVRGDVETVLLKAMEKEKLRRYQSGSALAEDVRCVLEYEPISARPAGAVYRLGKFVQRNKLAVASLAIIVLLLIGGITGTSIGLIGQSRARAQAERERDSLQAVVGFLNDDLLGSVKPDAALGREITVLEVVDKASHSVADRFKDKPEVESAVRMTLGAVYTGLGKPKEALPHLERSLELRRKMLGPDNRQTIETQRSYGVALQRTGRARDAEPILRDAADRAERIAGADDDLTLQTLNHLVQTLELLGRLPEAEPVAKRIMDGVCKAKGPEHIDSIGAAHAYARTLVRLGKPKEAEPIIVEVYQRLRRDFDPNHRARFLVGNTYASLLQQLNRVEEAELILADIEQRAVKVLGKEHPEALAIANNHAKALSRLNRTQEAEVIFREVVVSRTKTQGADHPQTIMAVSNLAACLLHQARYAEAEPLLRDAAEKSLTHPDLGKNHQTTRQTAEDWAVCLVAMKLETESKAVRDRFGVVPTSSPSK